MIINIRIFWCNIKGFDGFVKLSFCFLIVQPTKRQNKNKRKSGHYLNLIAKMQRIREEAYHSGTLDLGCVSPNLLEGHLSWLLGTPVRPQNLHLHSQFHMFLQSCALFGDFLHLLS